MAQKTNGTNLYTLPEKIEAPLRLFTDKLASGLGDNLQSITLVGSSLTEDFVPSQSDINTVLVLGKQTQETLNIIASLAKPMSKKKLSAPLLMTASYIERSRDVFGVELLDFQLIHKTILGDDPFASLSFDTKDVRLQCERELKAMLIRLRQGYIAAAANKKLVRDILISTSKSLTPILRAMLWLKDAERPILTNRTFKKAAHEFSCNMDTVLTVSGWRHEKVRLSQDQMQSTFEQTYSTVDKLSAIVDALEV
jgi:hypothetical protein